MNKLNFMYNGKNVLSIARDLTDAGLAEVALKIAETHPDVFAAAVLGEQPTSGSVVMPPVSTTNIVGTLFGNIDVTQHHLDTLNGIHDKVRAVKYLRETFNLNLKEAKTLSEDMARNGWVKNKQHWYETWEQSKDRYWEQSKAQAADDNVSLGDLLKQQLEDHVRVHGTRGY